MSEEQEVKNPGLSRRDFLKDAGLIMGGATLGSIALVNACGKTTETVTVPGSTSTVTNTVTTTTTVGANSTATVTVTTPKYVCSIDNQEFTTLEALKTHTNTAHGGMAASGMTQFIVNGKSIWREVKANWTLAYVLREKIGLTGTKRGCDHGDCGVCTVILDGRPTLSCLTLAVEVDGKSVTTVEGLVMGGSLDPLQQAFIENDAMQCGFCIPGQIMTAKALLTFRSKPTADEIKEFMAGTLCRCGAHPNIIRAIQAVAQ